MLTAIGRRPWSHCRVRRWRRSGRCTGRERRPCDSVACEWPVVLVRVPCEAKPVRGAEARAVRHGSLPDRTVPSCEWLPRAARSPSRSASGTRVDCRRRASAPRRGSASGSPEILNFRSTGPTNSRIPIAAAIAWRVVYRDARPAMTLRSCPRGIPVRVAKGLSPSCSIRSCTVRTRTSMPSVAATGRPAQHDRSSGVPGFAPDISICFTTPSPSSVLAARPGDSAGASPRSGPNDTLPGESG